MNKENIQPVIIIGAGVAGLAASASLAKAGIASLVLEKSRGRGGRCATRRGEDFIADTGAQFFNPRILSASLFKPELDSIIETIQIPGEKHPERNICRPGMSQLARYFVPDANIIHSEKVIKLSRLESSPGVQCYQLRCESGKIYFAQKLILTPPLPQSIELLTASQFQFSDLAVEMKLREVEYDPCLTLIIELSEPCNLGDYGIWKDPHPHLSGIYHQNEKGLDSKTQALVVHGAPDFSRHLWNQTQSFAEAALTEATAECLLSKNIKLAMKHVHFHRWKYSEPKIAYPHSFAQVGQRRSELYLAGDAFERSSIGGAIDSGITAARAMIESLSPN